MAVLKLGVTEYLGTWVFGQVCEFYPTTHPESVAIGFHQYLQAPFSREQFGRVFVFVLRISPVLHPLGPFLVIF